MSQLTFYRPKSDVVFPFSEKANPWLRQFRELVMREEGLWAVKAGITSKIAHYTQNLSAVFPSLRGPSLSRRRAIVVAKSNALLREVAVVRHSVVVDHLNPEQLSWLRSAIESELQAIRARQSDAKEVRTLVEDPLDMHERGSMEEERRRTLKLGIQDHRRIEELLAALVRIERGEYGICEESDEEIPYLRLCSNPAARFSAEAQAARESGDARERALLHIDDGDVY